MRGELPLGALIRKELAEGAAGVLASVV